MTMHHFPDDDPWIECCVTGDMIRRSVAAFDNWGDAYASESVMEQAMRDTDDDRDLRQLCAGWR